MPIGSHPIIPLMIYVGLKFILNHLSRPYVMSHTYYFLIHIATWTVDIFFIAHTKADIISIWLDAQKHLHIES